MSPQDLFAFHVSPLELVVRGTLAYWFLLLLFRFVMRRDVGAVGMADVLVLVLIADASQNAMSGGYSTLAEGAVLVGTLIGWNFVLDRLSFVSTLARKLLEPPPLVLVKQGRMNRRNMRREAITEEDLQGHLRQHGLEKVEEARLVCMESDGKVSVIPMVRGRAAGAGAPDVPGAR
jgi:uncharacterized membrane protein YcaP (DUF421 family)